ncbi:MAG: glycosyltransferase family 4 protein [Chloroflexi bacterium]|nr:glycosyltransferase family 4 protein [Chloroflexota bacterium]
MKVVFLTHNGSATALVRSQVLPYLRRLIARGVTIDLVSFERGDLPAPPEGIARWHPIRATAGQGLLAKVRDILIGGFRVGALLLRGTDVVHARSYLPAAIAWAAHAVLRRPYIFDMRGFLPEEYVEGGHWTERDLRYRVLRWVEWHLLRGAAAVVVLTHRAEERLRTEPRYARALPQETPVTVIPCAVDLDRFRPAPERRPHPTLVYAGSLGMWYALDPMLRVFAQARRAVPDLRFLVLNVGQHEIVRERAAAHGLLDAVEIRAASFDEMPGLLGGAHAGICLLEQASSKLGSSPIKVAEYLACGLPVVVNAGQGDTDSLVARDAAGHVITGYSDAEIARAAAGLVRLLGDEDARANARRLAEREYSADRAAEDYLGIYEAVSATRRTARTTR